MQGDEDQEEEFSGDRDEGAPRMWEDDPPICPACRESLDVGDEDIWTIDDIASKLPEGDVTEWCEEWLSASADNEELADFIAAELKGDGELASLVRKRMEGGEG